MAFQEPQTSLRFPLVALIGNPNAGKTSLFNALTGAYQKVGNYPGVTVEKVTGYYLSQGRKVDVVDVPGMYSTRPVSVDEEIAALVVESGVDGRRPDALVMVLDATNMERNLFLFSQLAESGLPTVVALTMTDLQEGGVDVPRLELELGVRVVPVVAHRKKGLQELKSAVEECLAGMPPPMLELGYPAALNASVTVLRENLAQEGVAMEDSRIRQVVLGLVPPPDGFPPSLLSLLKAEQASLLGKGLQGKMLDAQTRYAWAGKVTRTVVQKGTFRARVVTDRIDSLLTHKVFGLGVFFGVMYLLFQSVYTFSGPLMDLIESGVGRLKDWAGPPLQTMPVVQSLVLDGVLTGVGSVVVFLPQILILFLLIAVLEGSGYLARAAFLMDRLFGWCGLNGRAFIPLLSSFACAIPGIMAARVMPDQRSRLVTVLVAPLMSCSARLPVYVLFIGAFIQPVYGATWAGVALFAMHFVGLAVAIPVVALMQKFAIKGPRSPFLLELPPYQWPRRRDVLNVVLTRGWIFLKTAGTIIFALSIILWALLFFPRSAEADARYQLDFVAKSAAGTVDTSLESYVASRRTQDSYLGQFGKAMEPVFAPLGFDWRIGTAVLAAFPAREVVVSALGIMLDLGGEVDEESPRLREVLQQAQRPDGTPLMCTTTAIGMMLFFALSCQCMSTLAAIKRESNSWRWAVFAFVYMTVLAYLVALAVFQVGSRL